MASKILLDTNLLVLLIVGSTSERAISTHKRTRAYDIDSFRLLSLLIGSPSRLISTPHILAETSNLVRQCAEPLRSRLSIALAALIEVLSEMHRPARQVVTSRYFQRLGLTDAALLELALADMALLTDDLDLYVAAAKAGMACENFSHLRAAHAL